ncbi:hypothetical protein AGRO_3180 [Agrobacterium sp. ATCC 31749]|nr:hypothetical protein AGRO_3180 [Agrobacterium sp. ATCC 31749]
MIQCNGIFHTVSSLIRVSSSNGSYELSQRHDRVGAELELIFGDCSFQNVKSVSVAPTIQGNARPWEIGPTDRFQEQMRVV